MNDFCLEQTSLGFERLGSTLLLKLPWSSPPRPPPPSRAGNPPLNFSLYNDLLTDTYLYSTTFSVFLY